MKAEKQKAERDGVILARIFAGAGCELARDRQGVARVMRIADCGLRKVAVAFAAPVEFDFPLRNAAGALELAEPFLNPPKSTIRSQQLHSLESGALLCAPTGPLGESHSPYLERRAGRELQGTIRGIEEPHKLHQPGSTPGPATSSSPAGQRTPFISRRAPGASAGGVPTDSGVSLLP